MGTWLNAEPQHFEPLYGYYTLSKSKCEALGGSLSVFFIVNTQNKTMEGYTMLITDKTIIRTNKKENPYVMVDKFGLNDDRLSFKAKGIHVYLLSKPDNWKISVADLVKRSKDGEDSIRAGLKELQEYGYIAFKQGRSGGGKFGSTEYIIYERPYETDDKPHGENPDTESLPHGEKPHTVKPHTVNPTLIINDFSSSLYHCSNKEEEEEESAVSISESEIIFKELVIANKISSDTAHDMLKCLIKTNQRNISQYSAYAIRTTFVKLTENVATIHHIPSWFATTIKGQQDKYAMTYA